MSRRSFLVAGVALATLAAAWGSPYANRSQAAPRSSQPGRSVLQPDEATYASNQAASRREAAHLLTLLRLPSGALRAGPSSGAASALALMGRPAATTVIEKSEAWTVPMAYAVTIAWLSAHPPAGLVASGTTSSTAGEVFTYSAPSSQAWAMAELGYSVTPHGGAGSVVSAGVMVVPLDPRPLLDNAAGPRARVTLSTGCPTTDAHLVGVTNPGAGLTTSLLPSAEPAAGLVCLYSGVGGFARPSAASGQTLVHQAELGTVAARRLADQVKALPLGHIDGSVSGCPLDDGSYAIVVFSYKSLPDVDLWVALSGCGGVANGYIRTGSGALAQALRKLA